MPLSAKLIERLLHEPEGTSLDFKSAQYPFNFADDRQKTELLKDILAFANSWRRAAAYILIGVEETKGGRGRVIGVNEHLDDAKLHQFVNGKTQRPVELSYQVIQMDGTTIGAIEIPLQKRPTYLKKSFDRLREGAVFIRDGSSTRLATPDEIAQMGAEEALSCAPSLEPRFRIWLVDDKGCEIESIESEFCVFESMSSDDILACMELLKSEFPLVTNFGLNDSLVGEGTTVGDKILGIEYQRSPASDEEIARYTEQDYPGWIRDCKKYLRQLQDLLERKNGQPFFTFAVINEGTRPGHDTLINFIIEGDFEICPPPYIDGEEDDGEIDVRLPRPPRPPKGHWISKSTYFPSLHSNLLSMANSLSGILGRTYLGSEPMVPMPVLNMNKRRDPNAFYYKPNRPSTPQRSFSLECEQWRHGTEEEYFIGKLFFDVDKEKVTGELTCEVHAENLSVPTKRTFPVEITIKRVKTSERARLLIKELAGSAM